MGAAGGLDKRLDARLVRVVPDLDLTRVKPDFGLLDPGRAFSAFSIFGTQDGHESSSLRSTVRAFWDMVPPIRDGDSH
jgi:hypothetical protein